MSLRSVLLVGTSPAVSSSAATVSRHFHRSSQLQHGLYPYFNIHKPVTDPARQDPEYFEKEAEKIPLNSRYIDELKRLWEEKIGSERELIFKAQDRLIGNKGDFGLPPLDLSQPRLDYRGVDALVTAPESVKKIFSLDHGNTKDLTMTWKLEMIKKVRRDDIDMKSLPTKIAWATATIRNWTRAYAEHDVRRKVPIHGKMRPRATWISYPLYLLINHRRKMLKQLRQTNEEEFQKVISELKIAYHVEKEPEHVKTRKAWSEAQLKRRVALEKEKQLEELRQKFMENRPEKFKQIDEEQRRLEEEERQIHEKLHQLNIIEKKTVANVAGKYVPDFVGELREIATNGRFFFN